jgi:tRNA(Arg) A34 adenosine deaminase TadA
MRLALEQAQRAFTTGEVPVGAVVTDAQGNILASACNQTESRQDPTAHAEMLAIQEACRLVGNVRLTECALHVTLEPCPMCAQAISLARLKYLYFGAYQPKGGGVEHGARLYHQPSCFHAPEVIGGVEEEACGALLKAFFAARRLLF